MEAGPGEAGSGDDDRRAVGRDGTDGGDDGREDADDRPGLVRWWSGLGRGQQALLAVVAVVVVTNLVLAGARSMVGGDPGGPASSSFSTGGDGLEALADLLEAEGHPVARVRDTVTAADLPVAATAVVADPQRLGATEAERLARFVAGGG
ncbi:MAG TPA: DUF4350 domain-containing protein, partial [Aquihabitans sp.]|nr:DUF4350 domain-containing protein [Aquihabitans sp.]